MTIWELVGSRQDCKWLCTVIAKRTSTTMIVTMTRRAEDEKTTTLMVSQGVLKSTLVNEESLIKPPCKSSPRLCAKWCQTLMETSLKLLRMQLSRREMMTMKRQQSLVCCTLGTENVQSRIDDSSQIRLL